MSEAKLKKSDIVKGWVRYYSGVEVSNSYERMTALGFSNGMYPILKKLYGDDPEEFKEACERQLMFYNCEATWGSMIFGIVGALEEERSIKLYEGATKEELKQYSDIISNLKVGLMGPLAGIGDTINHGTIRPILMSLFIPLAESGFWGAGILPFLIWGVAISGLAYFLNIKGYTLGKDSIMNVLQSGKINQMINTCSVLGLFMMGALSASYVKLSTVVSWSDAVGNESTLQGVLDNIFPNLLPLAAVFAIYFYIKKSGPKYIRILLGIIIFSLIFAFFGIV